MPRQHDFRDNSFNRHSKALGELALVWNDLHMTLSSIFWTVTRIPNGLIANAIWNSIKSDRAQRDMIDAIVSLDAIGQIVKGPLRRELKWILKETSNLEEIRNNALHSPFLKNHDGSISSWHHLGNKRAKNIANKDVILEFTKFYDRAVALRDYAEAVRECIGREHIELPSRPVLPTQSKLPD
jgi:hypothetical protein